MCSTTSSTQMGMFLCRRIALLGCAEVVARAAAARPRGG